MNRSCNEKINISEVPMKKFLAMTMILAALLCSCGGETAEAEESAVSVNVDDESELAEDYDVYSIPCLVLFKDGKEVDRKVGTQPRATLEAWLKG